MIDKLLTVKKISPDQYKLYQLFAISDLGREYASYMIEKTFMESPKEDYSSPEVFAFIDGRRSIFREIKSTIDYVNTILREEEHVG